MLAIITDDSQAASLSWALERDFSSSPYLNFNLFNYSHTKREEIYFISLLCPKKVESGFVLLVNYGGLLISAHPLGTVQEETTTTGGHSTCGSRRRKKAQAITKGMYDG